MARPMTRGQRRKDIKPIGFMSESTAAYALVPNLITQLKSHFGNIFPVYFWSNREGSRVGYESMEGKIVKVLAAYARRPKVIHSGDRTILVKINSLLFKCDRLGETNGIPSIIGVPLVSSLEDFTIDTQCLWFGFGPMKDTDLEFTITLTPKVRVKHLKDGIVGPLNNKQIIEIAQIKCREMKWEDAVKGMRQFKIPDSNFSGYSYFFGVRYRPFFVVMLES